VALLLRKHGIKQIRPLQGGLQGWRDAGYPLDTKHSPELTGNELTGKEV
jgi:3-mercaptopyruvate sulfurtransferase SseA